jgi:hypothetical protein
VLQMLGGFPSCRQSSTTTQKKDVANSCQNSIELSTTADMSDTEEDMN